jgi:predicted Zn-ribbon and HTH transcriptional regulator
VFAQETGLDDHDTSLVDSGFDKEAGMATCPACGFEFETSTTTCPDCGLCFG